MLATYIGYGLTALVGLGIIAVGVRFLVQPRPSVAGFGVPIERAGGPDNAYHAVKGVRDIGSGLIALALIAAGSPHALGWFMVAASFIPFGDAIIVLRYGGPRLTAFGVHGATAVVMLIAAALLLTR